MESIDTIGGTQAPIWPPAEPARIVSTPGVCGGRPRIDGHRITVEDVAIWHERMGMSADEIVSGHPSIALSDVHAALAYYFDHRERIDQAILDGQRLVEEIKRKPRRHCFSRNFNSCAPMARTIRFHLDENCHRAVEEGLRRRGVDVTTTPEAGLLNATDDEQLTYRQAQARVIFTQDRDFLRIHTAGTSHPGIIYCDKGSRGIGEMIQGIVLIWEILEPAEMANRVEYL